jgi:hypothetical protein
METSATKPTRHPFRELIISGALLLPLTWIVYFPAALLAPDYANLFRPFWNYFAESVSNGTFPWWNPYTGLGRPFFSDVHTGLHYPPAYLLLLPETTGVMTLVWLHTVFGALGMKRLAVGLGAAPAWGWLAGVAFVFSGYQCGRIFSGQFFYAFGFCYLPWLLNEVIQLKREWHLSRIARLAILLSCQYLTGHPQVFWISNAGIWTFLILWILFDQTGRDRDSAIKRCGQLAAATGIAVLLTCFSWLPFLDLVANSNREEATLESASYISFQWRYLYGLVFGSTLPPREANGFTGFLWIVAGLAALFSVRDARLRAIFGTALLALAYSFGESSPIFQAAFHLLPGADGFRIPARSIIWVSFAVLLLGSVAMSRVADRISAQRQRYALIAVFAAITSVETAYMMPRWQSQNIISPESPFSRRFHDMSDELNLQSATNVPPRFNLPLGILPANAAAALRFSHVDGDSPLFLGRPWRYLHRVRRVEPDPNINTSLRPRFHEAPPLELPNVSVDFGVDFDQDSSVASIVANPSPLPRAWFSPTAYRSESEMASLHAMVNGFPVDRMTLVEKDPPPEIGIGIGISVPATPVEIVRFENSRLLLKVDTLQAGYLVLNEAWFPGWNARIGNQVIASEPVNHWMRGFQLPSGKHTVEVYFRPRFLWLAAAVSLLSLAALIVAFKFRQRFAPAPARSDSVGLSA